MSFFYKVVFHFLNYAYFIYDVAWRIAGMGEPGGLPSVESHRVGHDCRDLAATAAGAVLLLQET